MVMVVAAMMVSCLVVTDAHGGGDEGGGQRAVVGGVEVAHEAEGDGDHRVRAHAEEDDHTDYLESGQQQKR